MMQDLRRYTEATNTETALFQLHAAEGKMGQEVTLSSLKSWHRNWDNLTSFPLVALKGHLHDQSDKLSSSHGPQGHQRQKGAFTSEDAVLKQIYLATCRN